MFLVLEQLEFVFLQNILKKDGNVFYTQGLFIENNGNSLYESGGLYGESVLVKMDYPSLKIQAKINLKSNYFGEGTAKCGEYVYQLTWKEIVIIKYSFPDFKITRLYKLAKVSGNLKRVLLSYKEILEHS